MNHFLNYVETEFVKYNKKDRVQVSQQLFIIYLYLFYPTKYTKLLDGFIPDENKISERTKFYNDMQDIDDYIVSLLFLSKDTNPPDFKNNRSVYFINELATNHSLVELKQIIDSDAAELYRIFSGRLEKQRDQEFLYYIKNLDKYEYENVKEKLERVSIKVMTSQVRYDPNILIKYIFKQRLEESSDIYCYHYIELSEEPSQLFKPYEELFAESMSIIKRAITKSEEMYMMRSCLNLYGEVFFEESITTRNVPVINEKNVREYYLDFAMAIEKEKDFGQRDYDAETLIVQLGYRHSDLYKQSDLLISKIESIEKLKDSEYQYFWNYYHIKPLEHAGDIILEGGDVIKFDYKGKSYNKKVLNKLLEINRN